VNRLAKEYPSKTANTAGASTAGQKPSVAATITNAVPDPAARARASFARTVPAGTWRERVRGFRASISRSAQRLNAIALVRALTMQKSIASNLPSPNGA